MLQYDNKADNRGKAAPPYFESNMLIGVKSKYRVEKMIGGGGFGQVYRAYDTETKVVVAVKVEPKSTESARLVLELNVLLLLSKSNQTPKVYCSGEIGQYNFIVMQMLGKNLSDIRRKQRTRYLTILSSMRIGVQMICVLRQMHEAGYIHRDIKPSNICIGIGENRRVFYLVDFGMARKIITRDGKMRPERVYASFRGTTRYVSLATHERRDQGFVDDLWSLFYSIIELVEGLPWKAIVDQDEVYQAKKLYHSNFKTRKIGIEFEMFLRSLEKCKRSDIPNYDRLTEIMKSCCSCPSYNETTDFEWEADDGNKSVEYG